MITVNNVAPTVTITSVTSIDSVSQEHGGVDGQIDETEGFIVRGEVTDPGILDTHTVTLTVDLNWNGVYDDPGETVSLALQADPNTPGRWTFEHTVSEVLDDGPSPGNDTPQDPLTLTVTVNDDDTGTGSASRNKTVHNFAPLFVDLSSSLLFDDEGNVIEVTITGELLDHGQLDVHELSVQWDDGVAGDGVTDPLVLPPGQTTFTVSRSFPASAGLGEEDLFPVVVTLVDDDAGSDSFTFEPCSCNCEIETVPTGENAIAAHPEGEGPITITYRALTWADFQGQPSATEIIEMNLEILNNPTFGKATTASEFSGLTLPKYPDEKAKFDVKTTEYKADKLPGFLGGGKWAYDYAGPAAENYVKPAATSSLIFDTKDLIAEEANIAQVKCLYVTTVTYKDAPKIEALFFPERSWKYGTTSPELLKHEQGHFDITHAFAERLTKELKDLKVAGIATTRKNSINMAINKLSELAAQLYKKYESGKDDGQTFYDSKQETDHSENVPRQNAWNAVLPNITLESDKSKQLALRFPTIKRP